MQQIGSLLALADEVIIMATAAVARQQGGGAHARRLHLLVEL